MARTENQFDLIGWKEYRKVEDALMSLPGSCFTLDEIRDVLKITAEIAVSRFGAERSEYDALCRIREKAEARNVR